MVMVCEHHNIEMPILGVKEAMSVMSNPSLLSTFLLEKPSLISSGMNPLSQARRISPPPFSATTSHQMTLIQTWHSQIIPYTVWVKIKLTKRKNCWFSVPLHYCNYVSLFYTSATNTQRELWLLLYVLGLVRVRKLSQFSLRPLPSKYFY